MLLINTNFPEVLLENGFTIFSLSVKLRNKQEGFQWWLSCIYGPSLHSNKHEFSIDLNDLENLTDGRWCAGGDFNEILYSSDRKDSTSLNAHADRFHN